LGTLNLQETKKNNPSRFVSRILDSNWYGSHWSSPPWHWWGY
jgi:hypothetical protein